MHRVAGKLDKQATIYSVTEVVNVKDPYAMSSCDQVN